MKRCWMVGTGPSLGITPMDRLVGKVSFSTNMIANIFPQTKWRPTYYVGLSKHIAFGPCLGVAREAVKSARAAFIDKTIYDLFSDLPNVRSLNFERHRVSLWSDDITRVVNSSGSTLFSAMQIAAWMGFNEIYLVGCDMGWKETPGIPRGMQNYPGDDVNNRLLQVNPPDPNHFPGCWPMLIGVDPTLLRQRTETMLMTWEYAKQQCEQRGIKIYNATIGGELEVFPRVRFEDVV